MISLYGGPLVSVCLLIAVMVTVSLVSIGIRTVRLLCLTSCQVLWICVVFILFGICFLHGRRIANRLSGVVLLWGNSTSNSIGKITIRSDLTHASVVIR